MALTTPGRAPSQDLEHMFPYIADQRMEKV